MCSDPVTFGGGITMEKLGPAPCGVKAPESSQCLYHLVSTAACEYALANSIKLRLFLLGLGFLVTRRLFHHFHEIDDFPFNVMLADRRVAKAEILRIFGPSGFTRLLS